MESKDKYSSETFQIYLLLGVLKTYLESVVIFYLHYSGQDLKVMLVLVFFIWEIHRT